MRARRLPSWGPTAGVAVALVGLIALSCWQRWVVLTESPFPVGVDGYFYPIQLRSLLETGALQYPASPLSFYLMAPLAALTDPIVGAKLGAALFGALVALPAYGIGARLGRSRGAGLIAAAIATTSAGSAFLTVEFVKNGVGVTVALTAVWCLLRMLERRSRARIIAFAACVIAAYATHKMAAALVAVIAIPAVLADAAGRGALRGRRLLYTLGALALLVITAIVIGIAFPKRVLSTADLALVHDLASSTPRWTAPALAGGGTELALDYEPLIAGGLGVLTLLGLQRGIRGRFARALGITDDAPRTPGMSAVAWSTAILALAIALPWLAVADPMALGFRLRIVAFVPLALCGSIVAPLVVAGFAREHRVRELVLAAIAVLVVVAVPRDRTEGRILTHPALVAAAQALTGRIPAGATAIVPERHIAYMIAWYTRAPVSTRPDPIDRAHRWRVMPLAFIGAGSPLDDALIAARREPSLTPPLGTHPRHPNGLVLVAEPTWEWILAHLPGPARTYYARWPVI